MESKIQLGTGEDPLGSDRFEQLVRDHERRVLAIAYQICGDLEDARDVAQEAFLRAFRYRRGFRPEQRFSSWLNRITVNAALDLLRKRSQGDFQPKTAEILESRGKSFPEPSPEDRLAARSLFRNSLSVSGRAANLSPAGKGVKNDSRCLLILEIGGR